MKQAQRMEAEQAARGGLAEPQAAVLDESEVLGVLEKDFAEIDDDSARAIKGIRNGVLISAGFWIAAGLAFVILV